MGRRGNYSGLVVAAVGFGLTRFTVTLALYEDPLRFVAAGVVPLVLGLGLAAFGVALVVADVDATLVRTTARWCVIGTATMLLLVLLTLVGSTGGLPEVGAVRSQLYLSNFLIGGSVGGTLTGLYAARTRRQNRALRQQTDRLEVLNRILRHEVLNAVMVIRGYAADAGEDDAARDVIQARSGAIADTIEEMKYLTRSATRADADATTELSAHLRAAIRTVRDAHPEATITVEAPADDYHVRATDRLERVFVELLENAVVHTPGPEPVVTVAVETTATTVTARIRDAGPGLPDAQQTLLETGRITEFDDPKDGYGLNVARLLVESFDGRIDTDVTPAGTTIAVTLDRPRSRVGDVAADSSELLGLRLDGSHLAVTLAAALVAGVVYGVVAEQLGGSIAAIGVFYGIANPIVGWLTHEFHSVVFAFTFAGLVSYAPPRYRDHVPAYVVVGLLWGVCLWLVAAGVVAPVWLQLLGVDVPIPTLRPDLLASHAAWGGTLGLLTALGYRYVTPILQQSR